MRRAALAVLSSACVVFSPACVAVPASHERPRVATASFPRDADRLDCLDAPVDLAVTTARADRDTLVVRIANLRAEERDVTLQGAILNVSSCSPPGPRHEFGVKLGVLDADSGAPRPTVRLPPNGVARVVLEPQSIDLPSRCVHLELAIGVKAEGRVGCLEAGTWMLDLDHPHLSTTELSAPPGQRYTPPPSRARP